MTDELRVALVGFGLGGRAFHAPLIAATPGLRLATIVTSNSERRAEAEQAFPGARIAESVEWVWANVGARSSRCGHRGGGGHADGGHVG